MSTWTERDVPDQRGRTAVVTGGNTGVGYATALVLARCGADVVLACRDDNRSAGAAERIRNAVPGAAVRTLRLDLASLDSVRRAAAELRGGRIDLLVNNAGGIRVRHGLSADGYELTFATNHLGPFALTGLLLDRLLATPGSRVVTVSSIGHRRGVIRFDDLMPASGYRASRAYFQSKLANLMFTYELARRLAGTGTIAVAAHPGNARTEFARDMNLLVRLSMDPRLRPVLSWLMQSAEMGALASLRAATDPAVRNGEYYGPPGRAQFVGHPERVDSSPRSHDEAARVRLWRESERLTGVVYPVGYPGRSISAQTTLPSAT